MFDLLYQGAEEALSPESLATIPGIVAVILVVVQIVKAVAPAQVGVGWLRLLAVVLGVALASLAALSGVTDQLPAVADGIAAVIIAWVFVVLNGLVAATSAMGTFDLVKETRGA